MSIPERWQLHNRVAEYYRGKPPLPKSSLVTYQMRQEVLRALNQRKLSGINREVLNLVDEVFMDTTDEDIISSDVMRYHEQCSKYQKGYITEAAVVATHLGHISKELFGDFLYLNSNASFSDIGCDGKNTKDLSLIDFIATLDLIYKRHLNSAN
jgi:hypothetical protein